MEKISQVLMSIDESKKMIDDRRYVSIIDKKCRSVLS